MPSSLPAPRPAWRGRLAGRGRPRAQPRCRRVPRPAPEEVSVVFGSEQIEITLDALAPVNLPSAWSVLIDYEHMSQFLPGLDLSEVSRRQGNELRVHQRGNTRVGPLRFDYENVRDISLTPQRLITAHVSGDFKRLDTRTELTPREGGVQLHYHALVEPAPLPAFLGNSAAAPDGENSAPSSVK
jgi:carbon monoxide dehydrogenase subunit G